MLCAAMIRLLSIGLFLVHLGLVAYIGYWIAGSSDPVAVNAWLLFIPLDFPVSLLMIAISHLIYIADVFSAVDENGIYSLYRDIPNYWFPMAFFGIVGSAWWYSVPYIVVKLKKRLRSKGVS